MARLTRCICVTVLLSLLLPVRGFDSSGDGSGFYVSSARRGCVSVQSQRPCPASILSPDIATDYDEDAEWIDVMLNETKMNNGSEECIAALTIALCSTLTPRCFVNGSKDFGDARAECWKANRTCPVDSLEEGTCESLKTGLKPFSSCVKPSKAINGSCPQPKYKMPEDKLELYKRSSEEYQEISYFENLTTARYANGTRMFSSECVSKITELYCLQFYCSDDEEQIVTEYTYEDCENIFNDCFDPVAEELSGDELDDILDLKDKYVHNCDFYPDAIEPTSPPGIIGSPTPSTPGITGSPTALREATTTHPVQNVSSTPPGQNVTTIPPGRNMSTTPPGRNMSTTPTGQNVSSTPPGKNVSSVPPSHDVSSTAPGEPTSPHTKQTPPSVRPSEILITPSPTAAGNERSQNFLPLLLLASLILVQLY